MKQIDFLQLPGHRMMLMLSLFKSGEKANNNKALAGSETAYTLKHRKYIYGSSTFITIYLALLVTYKCREIDRVWSKIILDREMCYIILYPEFTT